MLYVCRRRHSRNRFVTFLTILGAFVIISLIIRSSPIRIRTANRKDNTPRLFCVLIHTNSLHEQFVYLSNLTWAKHCHKIGIARFRRLQKPNDGFDTPQLSYYVDLWTCILSVIRDIINYYEYISNNDLLIIVPAATFVFPEKLSLLVNTSQSPLIIIHKQNEANAYILNGLALNLVRNTQLMDSCLQQLHPAARDKQLWECVKSTLHREHSNAICQNADCFIQYHENQVTLAHIKNGFCFQDNLHLCHSIALFYPTTDDDFVTLEFFKYRLKPKPSNNQFSKTSLSLIQCNEFLQYSNVKSHVLEIGSGTRINFPCSYHHTNIKSYVGIEPNIHMHPYLNEFISRYNISYTVHLLNNSATDMYEIESNSISDPLGAKVLSKVYRILKPGEKCLFFVHILANSPTDFFKK